jgi:hypothetical protein
MTRMRSIRIVAVLTTSAAVFPLSSANALRLHADATCHASAVHYRTVKRTPRGVAGVPWIASTTSAFRGYLFYWGGTRWARTRPRAALIFTTKTHLRVNPKVLWVALQRSASTMAIHGTRLDGSGSFSARYPAAIGGGQFPSYVQVPAAGCWRVAVSSGSLRGSVTFVATNTP